MTKDEALKLALSCIKSSTEYKRGNATFVEAAEDVEQSRSAPVQEPVQVWQAEGYDALMQEMQMVKARNIRQYAEIKRLSALVTPPAQPAVPDAFGTREGEHPQYIQGWNDCRAEMLRGMKP